MPAQTPKQRLIEAVRQRFVNDGFYQPTAYPLAVLAVEAFYAENLESEHHALVAEEALGLVMEAMPPFVTHMRAAFESMQAAMRHVTESARVAQPWAELAERLNQERKRRPTKFDASGLPVEEGQMAEVPSAPADRQGEPCIEEGCGSTAVPGTAFCRDCMPTPTLQPFNRVAHGLAADAPAPTFQMSMQGANGEWMPVEGILSIELGGPPEVIELTEREYHLAAARRLRQLGCTYQQLKAMHDRGDFETSQHHSAWFTFGGLINLEQLDRANFVLDNLARGDAFDIDMDDAAIERAEAHYPTDRITGAPHHFIVNGDHSGCGCGGHDPSCEVWDAPAWNHKATLCRIPRTNCRRTGEARHTYGQACAEYQTNLIEDISPRRPGRTTEGEEVRGPASD